MPDIVTAWHPSVPGVREVLHATFREHIYPAHTHDEWAVLLIDAGVVAYDLDHGRHFAEPSTVTLLPPSVPHDGRSAVDGAPFRKRVIYLHDAWLPPDAVGEAARQPTLDDPRALRVLHRIHAALDSPGDEFEVESGMLALGEIATTQFSGAPSTVRDVPLARRLRELLDQNIESSLTIADAAREFGTHPSHLIRAFSQAYGIPPHRYLTGRRVDLARRLLRSGTAPADAAAAAGFHDQSHLTRHFRRVLGTTPGTFAA